MTAPSDEPPSDRERHFERVLADVLRAEESGAAVDLEAIRLLGNQLSRPLTELCIELGAGWHFTNALAALPERLSVSASAPLADGRIRYRRDDSFGGQLRRPSPGRPARTVRTQELLKPSHFASTGSRQAT